MTRNDENISLVDEWNALTPVERGDLVRRLRSTADLTADQASRLITVLVALAKQRIESGQSDLLAAAADAILNSFPASRFGKKGVLSEEDIGRLRELYALVADTGHAAGQVLRLLAVDASRPALETLAELLVDNPPADHRDAAWAITPLIQHREFDVSSLFPRLLAGLAHRQTAALILDLANFVTRQRNVAVHPASSRAGELVQLLGRVVQHLTQIEENPQQFGQSPEVLRSTVDESLALCVSLCDALALIGGDAAKGKLHQALQLGHRRIRTEAAVALARLGDQQGLDVLVELAADPATRTRALAYLEELDALERAKPEDRTPVARAAAELSDWLAEPGQFGAAPHSVEWIDTCRQYWPGYSHPLECRLFVYTYHLRDGDFSGVGIVGPVTYSLAADLEDLSPDDIYACFAGWQAEHEEVQEIAAEDLPEWKRKAHQARMEQLTRDQYANVRLCNVGHFFGDEILIATADREGCSGTIVLEGDQLEWYPAGATRRPIGPTEAYYIFKGRKLLRAFNPEEVEHLDESSPTSKGPAEGI